MERSACHGVGFEGQRGGAGRGGWGMVPPIRWHAAKVDTCRQQRRGIAVAERVDRSPRMETARVAGSPTGVWPTAAGPRCGGRGHACTTPAWGGQEPYGMAVDVPVLASPLQSRPWKRHIAVLGAFASAHVDQPACPVNVRDLQVSACLKAPATGVDGGETHPRAPPFEVCQHGADLCATADDREFLCTWGSDTGQRGPWSRQGVLRETRETAQGDGTGAARVMLDVFKIEEVVAPFCLGDAVGGLVVMLRQLADGPDRPLLGPCGQASEL
jgi:hypothetical protein